MVTHDVKQSKQKLKKYLCSTNKTKISKVHNHLEPCSNWTERTSKLWPQDENNRSDV